MATKENTRIEYMYRDGSNYKEHHAVVIEGRLTFEKIVPHLDEGEYFIPDEVGLPELQERFRDFPNEDDHVWHTIYPDDVTATVQPPDLNLTASELLEAFKQAPRDEIAASQRLGIRL